jgi:hypothetical protein
MSAAPTIWDIDERRREALLRKITRRFTALAVRRRQPDPVEFVRSVGFEPDPWQAQVLCSLSARLLLNCSRQSGKSTVAGYLVCYTALYDEPGPILLLSPSERQSKELFRKTLDVYRALGRPIPAESETKLTLELENGSRIIALPGSEATVRGFSGVRLLVVDEASRVDDALYRAVRPMLAVSGGRLCLLSTPFGKRGFFYDEWTNGQGWERVEVPAEQCPRIDPTFLAEERRVYGPSFYSQEYGCRFIDVISALFSYESVMGAVSGEIAPLFPVVAPFALGPAATGGEAADD